MKLWVITAALACRTATTPTQSPRLVAPPAPASGDAGPIVVFGDAGRWCYKSADLGNEGACGDSQDICEVMHADRLLWEVTSIRDTQHVDAVTAAKVAQGMWQQSCQIEDAVACIRGTQVVPGTRYEVCFPTMRTCELKRYAQGKSMDFRPDGPCFVYRRRPAEPEPSFPH